MKKMTIALFTAAAMGTSGFAVAQTGPDFSGDIRINNTDGNTNTLTVQRIRLEVSGAGEPTVGTETFYYLRFAGDREDDVSGNGADVRRDYGYIGLRGEMGQISAGFDDDLVYKFAGAQTDVFRSQLPGSGDDLGDSAAGFTTYSTGHGTFEDPSVQGEVNVGIVTLAGYADTSEGNGLERVQVAGSIDLSPLTVAAVYSQRDTTPNTNDSEYYLSGGYDAGLFSVGAHVGRTEIDTNPYGFAVSIPVNGNISTAIGYGDNDNGLADAMGQVIYDLGGGLDVFANYRTGDSEDGLLVGAQYTF